MNKSTIYILFVFLFLSGCTFKPESKLTKDCSQSLTSILEIQNRIANGLDAHDSFEIQGGGPRKAHWFDVNEFISVLPHIKVQEGYTIDYVQFKGQNGSPILYARKTGEYPYASFDDMQNERVQAIDEISKSSKTLEEYEKAYKEYQYRYMNFIQTDNSAESFVEFIIFRIIGDQFYLMWHANYNDTRPICNISDLEKAIKDAVAQGSEITKLDQLKKEAVKINLSPTVEFQKEIVIVKLFVFTKFGGLYQSTTTIQRDFPHRVIDEQFDLIIKHDAPFRY